MKSEYRERKGRHFELIYSDPPAKPDGRFPLVQKPPNCD
jgi:hypothetical protein